MIALDRTNRGILGHWWWTVDRTTLGAVTVLAIVGIFMVFAASPPVARTYQYEENHFIYKHLTYLFPAALVLIGVSMLNARGVLRLGLGLLAVFGTLVALTLLIGPEIKGSTRWLTPSGLRVQPSEFVKPALAIAVAYLIARKPGFTGVPEALAIVIALTGILLMQPDLGMSMLVLAVFGGQLFVAGISWWIVGGVAALGVGSIYGAYTLLPHVRERIDGFLDPETEIYQVVKALSAVSEGGLFGRGPGEGVIKFRLPEAHSDFVFATAAEEFGIIACLIIVAVFALVTLRGLSRLMQSADRFVQLAAAGLVIQFGLQALINMAVNLNLVPTKGMTLPLISYGGSSTLALAIGLGMLLALTRRGAGLGPGFGMGRS